MNCSNLGSIYFLGDAPTIGENVFSGSPAKIYIEPYSNGFENTQPGPQIVTLDDADGDLISDRLENILGSDPGLADTDSDNANDLTEKQLGTNFNDADDLPNIFTYQTHNDTNHATTILKCIITNASDAVRNCDKSQTCARPKCSFSNTSDAVRNCDARQALAAAEGITPYTGDAITNRDARHSGAGAEGTFPDANDAIRNRDTRQVS